MIRSLLISGPTFTRVEVTLEMSLLRRRKRTRILLLNPSAPMVKVPPKTKRSRKNLMMMPRGDTICNISRSMTPPK